MHVIGCSRSCAADRVFKYFLMLINSTVVFFQVHSLTLICQYARLQPMTYIMDAGSEYAFTEKCIFISPHSALELLMKHFSATDYL